MDQNGINGQAPDIDDEPTEQLEPVVDHGLYVETAADERLLDDLETGLTDEWP